MAKLVTGLRIARQGTLALCCSAVVFDDHKKKVLLTKRADNGRWCLPGGHMEPGENASEACAREVWEETGLRVIIKELLGIYSSPDRVIEYGDGSRYHLVVLNFNAEPVNGVLKLSRETTDYGYFSLEDMSSIDVMENHLERIQDAFAFKAMPFLR
jgi:8-oxo-dGTP pyrophosphatase MutT (NUDIX family)